MKTVSKNNNLLQNLASKAGWGAGLVTKNDYKKQDTSKSSFQFHICNNAFNSQNGLNIDAIYFTDTYPVIYIKELKDYNHAEIIKIHKQFWNECRTPLTLIITPAVISILDNYATPVESENEISKLEREKFEPTETNLNRLAEILQQAKLDSELVLGKTIKLHTQDRVDKTLIKQLRAARKELHEKYNLEFSTIHDLLGRSLFTLYLEQRGILDKKDIIKETKVCDIFFDLLLLHPTETITLFNFLKEKFNGDLFSISSKEIDAVQKNPKIFEIIYYCFTGKVNIQTTQRSLFNLFDFKHIPIEFISAVYEEFMSEEDEKKNKIIDKDYKGKKELGAFYTPQSFCLGGVSCKEPRRL